MCGALRAFNSDTDQANKLTDDEIELWPLMYAQTDVFSVIAVWPAYNVCETGKYYILYTRKIQGKQEH